MKKGFRPILFLAIIVLLAAFTLNSLRNFFTSKTISQLLAENKYLKEAITNLTQEEQIGYAKVISKEVKDGKLFTTLKFVETARGDKLKKILEKKYTIEGDVIYFDALIVKFGDKMVMDGKQKSVYLWRRVYGEKTPPEKGFPIEQPGNEPARYADMMKKLTIGERELFWSNIWELANQPDKLKDYSIDAIYGNAVYQQLRAGLIYIFKITPTGQVYPEVVPEM
jgi:hypothetical protein